MLLASPNYTSGLQAQRLELGIEEAAVVANTELTAQCLKQWKRLGVRVAVIAEEFETEAQFHMLLELGCLQAQGYLLMRPMPAVQAQVALRKPWGNLPKEVRRPRPAIHEKYAS